MKWQFKDEAPLSFKVTATLFALNFLVDFAGFWTLPRWSTRQPDSVHSYAIRFKGGMVYFVQPWLGKYLEHIFWAHFILLALLFLIMWLHRDEIERIS